MLPLCRKQQTTHKMEQQHKRGVDVEEGQPLMSHQHSPSPLLAREAPPSPTLSSYQSFPRTSISYSAPAAPPHHSAQGVLARLSTSPIYFILFYF
jgi:hypothetical protein